MHGQRHRRSGLRAGPQLRRRRAFRHHGEVALDAVGANKERVVLAGFTLTPMSRALVYAPSYSLWFDSITVAPASAATLAIFCCDAMY